MRKELTEIETQVQTQICSPGYGRPLFQHRSAQLRLIPLIFIHQEVHD